MVQTHDSQVEHEELAIFIDDRATRANPLPRTLEYRNNIDILLEKFKRAKGIE